MILSRQESSEPYEAEAQRFLGQTAYAALSRRARRVHEAHPESNAYYAPVVQFLLTVTFNTLSQPSVAARLPNEVYEREGVASDLARKCGRHIAQTGILATFYRNNEHLGEIPDGQNLARYLALRDEGYISGIGGGPFIESSRVIGGAARAIRLWGKQKQRPAPWSHMPDEPIAATVKRSRNLQVTGGLSKDTTSPIYTSLGTPYIQREHFVPAFNAEGLPIVRYEPDTLAFISQALGKVHGCPARRIASDNHTYDDLFDEAWIKITDYYLIPGATTFGIRSSRGRRNRR